MTLDDVIITNLFDTVFSSSFRTVHVQDATGGITIFDTQASIDALFAGLSEGDSISIDGPTTGFNGLFELASGVSNVVPLGSPGVPIPVEITPLDLVNLSPTAEGLESELVNLSSVQFTGLSPGQTFTCCTNYTVTDGVNSGMVRLTNDIGTPHPLEGLPIPINPVNVKGIFSQFDTNAPPPTQTASGYQVLIKTVFPEPGQTDTFIDRQQATDLRVVSYNVLSDTIFPDNNPAQAAKFVRVVNALDPDILNLQEINRSAIDVVNLMNSIAPLSSGSWQAHQGRDNVIVSKFPLSMTETDTSPAGQREQAIALVDLPDEQFGADFYFMNNHYKCCGSVGSPEDNQRQQQSDAIVNWIRDARTPGGVVDLPPGTPIAVVGDLNIVGGPQPLNTLVDGNIIDESTYGSDSPPDWDGSFFTDAHPLHNGSGPDDYTWRNDNSSFDPGRLDYIIYSDSALDVGNQFVLNTVDMSAAELAATGLLQFDITVDLAGVVYDHLPVVVDFRVFDFADSDFNFDRLVDNVDLDIWETGYGTAGGAAHGEGDANGDAVVDGRDMLLWQLEHTGAGPLLAAIPEPSSLALLLLGWLLPMRRSR
ncbi:MAG: endonuclease/exonuclease/phosphatase family protein [Planctomycetes bacterium]|nr:endonuclease/exonuclease/phosphatase family protein [Planctomycetota bacterium]